MKFRMTVTVDIVDTYLYTLDNAGWPISNTGERINKVDVMEYVAEATSTWGGQFPPGDPLFPTNIRSVTVRSDGFETIKVVNNDT